MITVAVEGDTDIPFVTRLCEAAGFTVRMPLVDTRGKPDLDAKIEGFGRAGRGSPHLVLRDLDHDAACAPAWMKKHAPKSAGQFFALRLAVRAVEAWFLADSANAARALAIPEGLVPNSPDEEHDPKRAIVDLAQRSSKADIRAQIIPRRAAKRKTAAGYEAWLLAAAERWSFERAVDRSPSLERAHRFLVALRSRWESRTT